MEASGNYQISIKSKIFLWINLNSELNHLTPIFLHTSRNWVSATNSNFLIPIWHKSDNVNLRYFNLRPFDLTKYIVWNIKGLRHRVAQIRDYTFWVCGKNSFPLCISYWLPSYFNYTQAFPPYTFFSLAHEDLLATWRLFLTSVCKDYKFQFFAKHYIIIFYSCN